MLGISPEENKVMCAIGTTDNGLVKCKQTILRGTVMLSMPVLGPDLETTPPETEQVDLAAQAVDPFLRACPSLAHLVPS